MTLNETQIKEVQDFAGCFFSPGEIGIIMNLGEQWCMMQMSSDTEFRKAYYKGRLISEADLRKPIFELAKKGSAPAQALAIQIVSNSYLKDVSL